MVLKLSKWLIVVALAISIGAHWAILQSVAWCGMIITYSQSAPLRKAIVKTFDGDHPCQLCKMVSAAKKSEKKQSNLKVSKQELFLDAKIHFACEKFPAQPNHSAPEFLASLPQAPLTPPPNPA